MAAESSLETQLLAWAFKQRLLAPKLMLPGQRGWPDRAVLLPGNRVCWLELKAPGGVLSRHQIEWIRQLKAIGHAVAVCDTFEQCVEAVRRIEEGVA